MIIHDPYLDFETDIRDHLDRFEGRQYYGKTYVQDLTFEEARSVYLMQRVKYNRSTENDKKYKVQTPQEVFDLFRMLNEEFPRTVNAERKIGLYIELKDW